MRLREWSQFFANGQQTGTNRQGIIYWQREESCSSSVAEWR